MYAIRVRGQIQDRKRSDACQDEEEDENDKVYISLGVFNILHWVNMKLRVVHKYDTASHPRKRPRYGLRITNKFELPNIHHKDLRSDAVFHFKRAPFGLRVKVIFHPYHSLLCRQVSIVILHFGSTLFCNYVAGGVVIQRIRLLNLTWGENWNQRKPIIQPRFLNVESSHWLCCIVLCLVSAIFICVSPTGCIRRGNPYIYITAPNYIEFVIMRL